MTFATNEMKAIGVKVVFEQDDEMRRVSFNGNTFSALRDLVASLFSLDEQEKEKITIKYKDDEGDLITMSVDNDVQEATKQAEQTNMRTIRLFVQVREQPTTPTPTPVQREGRCEERKKEWKAKREAFMKGMHEAKGLLFSATQAGDTQTVEKMRAKLQELRTQWSANRHVKLTTTPAHVIAHMRIPCDGISQKGNVDAQERQAMWAEVRCEVHGNRVALLEAKARGDMKVVRELREKICKIRQEHRAKLGHHDPVTPLPLGPCFPGRMSMHFAHAGRKAPVRHAHPAWEALRQEKQGLLEALISAQKSGDSQAIAEAQRNLKEFRERAHRARHEEDGMRFPHPPHHHHRVHLPFGIPRPFIAFPGPIPAPPAPAHAYDSQARRDACEAVRQERMRLREALFAAKAQSDIPAVEEAREQLCAMRQRQIALRIARREAFARAAVLASDPASAPAPAPVECPAPAPSPAVVTLSRAPPVHAHRLAHKFAFGHPCARQQI